ncbi:MAG: hypothetical protein HC916_19490 [Coleofasciculaceae cyanobacterium SM2_1_6]|nr:hypothetical protein [Coleofasciculaceae cyanobacterium SM2_1_6]
MAERSRSRIRPNFYGNDYIYLDGLLWTRLTLLWINLWGNLGEIRSVMVFIFIRASNISKLISKLINKLLAISFADSLTTSSNCDRLQLEKL